MFVLMMSASMETLATKRNVRLVAWDARDAAACLFGSDNSRRTVCLSVVMALLLVMRNVICPLDVTTPHANVLMGSLSSSMDPARSVLPNNNLPAAQAAQAAALQEAAQAAALQEAVQPAALQEAAQPAALQEAVQPAALQEAAQAAALQEAVQPAARQEAAQPAALQEAVQPARRVPAQAPRREVLLLSL